MTNSFQLARLVVAFGLGAVLWGHAADCSAARPTTAFVSNRPAPSPPPHHVFGMGRMLHPPSPCDVPAFSTGGPGIPYFVADPVPTVGQPFHVQWSTKPTEPGDSPTWPAFLFVSFTKSVSWPLDVFGAPGCHLQVAPEFIMVPSAGSILTQAGGQVYLDWTPHPSLVGETFYAQLFVRTPGVNEAGFLLSPALQVVIGS